MEIIIYSNATLNLVNQAIAMRFYYYYKYNYYYMNITYMLQSHNNNYVLDMRKYIL